MCPRICQTLGCPSGPRSVGRVVTGVHSRAAPLPTFLSLRGARQGPPQGLEGPRAEEQPCWAPPWTQRVCRVWGAPQKPDPRGRDSRLLHTTPQGSGLRSYRQMSARGLVAGLRGGAQCWGGWRGPLTSRTSGGGGLWQRLTWAVRGEACGWAGWGTGTGGAWGALAAAPRGPSAHAPLQASRLTGGCWTSRPQGVAGTRTRHRARGHPQGAPCDGGGHGLETPGLLDQPSQLTDQASLSVSPFKSRAVGEAAQLKSWAWLTSSRG